MQSRKQKDRRDIFLIPTKRDKFPPIISLLVVVISMALVVIAVEVILLVVITFLYCNYQQSSK